MRLAPLAVAALLIATSPGCPTPGGRNGEAGMPLGWVEIRGQRVEVEIADDPMLQSRGLGYRDKLAWGRGMLFAYPRSGFYNFWMKGMRFDIDIVWIRNDRIVHIHHRVPHVPEGTPLPSYSIDQLVDRVLEVPAGYAQASGWHPGDRVQTQRNDPG